MEKLLNTNTTSPMFLTVTIIGFIVLFYILNLILPYDIYEIVCHAFVSFLLLFVFYEFNKKNKAIKLLNETILEKEKLTKELEKIATKDSLTGIGNRRYYFDLGDKAFALAKRDESYLSMITIDIDNFKDINDKFGHQVGDDILKLVASCMEKELRKSDILARVGGEEFSIVLPNTDLDNAMTIAEKIKSKINTINYIHKDIKVIVTGSFGVSQNSKDDKDLDDIYARADKALYKAKSSGKNRVCYS